MIAYWLLFAVVAIGLLLDRMVPRSASFLLFRLAILVVLVMVGLRHEVGGDWAAYEDYFYRYASASFLDVLGVNKDPGYFILGWGIAKAGGSVHFLNFACAGFFVTGLYQFCRQQPNPWLALLVALPYLVIVVAMGYTRQSVAIGLSLIALHCLGERRIWWYVGLIALAATFHRSALVMLPLAAFVVSRGRLLSLASVSCVGLFLAYFLVGDESDMLVRGYVSSDYASASAGGAVRVAMIVAPALVYLAMSPSFDKDPSVRRMWKALSVGALLMVPMLFVSITATDRLALYLAPVQIHVLATAPQLIEARLLRPILVSFVACLMFFVQFTWLNYAVNAESWLPYRNVLIGVPI